MSVALTTPNDNGHPLDKPYVSSVEEQFDYSRLAANLAGEARESARRIKLSQRDHIIEVGLELLKIKDRMAHGFFTDWIDRALNFAPTTARNYMRAAEAFADKPATVAVLPPSTLYRLAGAPPEIRSAIVAQIEAGILVDRADIDHEISYKRKVAVEAKRLSVVPAEQKKRAEAAQERRQRKWDKEEQERNERHEKAATELLHTLALTHDFHEIAHLNQLWRHAGYHVVDRLISLQRSGVPE